LAIHLRTWRDIMLAGAIGLTAEAVIWLLDFEARRNLFGDVPVWVQIAEMPGAQVADKLFSQWGLALALTFGILFQAALFSAVALSIIYICRLIR